MARKEKKYHFIYKTTNLLSGKYYIGMHSTDDLNDGYMGSGKRLRYSINKYGKENHKVEIIEFFEDRKQLAAREKEVVNLNEIAKDECMNLMPGGKGGFISEEQQRNRSKSANIILHKKLKSDSSFKEEWLKNLIIGVKKAIGEGKIKSWKENYDWTGKKHSSSTKELMSEKAKLRVGEKNSQYGTCWITKGEINKKIKKEDLKLYLEAGWVKGRK